LRVLVTNQGYNALSGGDKAATDFPSICYGEKMSPHTAKFKSYSPDFSSSIHYPVKCGSYYRLKQEVQASSVRRRDHDTKITDNFSRREITYARGH